MLVCILNLFRCRYSKGLAAWPPQILGLFVAILPSVEDYGGLGLSRICPREVSGISHEVRVFGEPGTHVLEREEALKPMTPSTPSGTSGLCWI